MLVAANAESTLVIDEFPPHQALAAVRVRRGEPPQGRRRGRAAPTSSISAWAIRICRRRSTSSTSWSRRCAKPRTHRYSASKGIPGLRRAQAAYYERRFGVKLDPETQVVATLGSKEGFANMAQAITAPGDVIIVPNPTYPIHEFGFLISGAADAARAGRQRRGFPARGRARGAAIRFRSRWRSCSPIRPIRRR